MFWILTIEVRDFCLDYEVRSKAVPSGFAFGYDPTGRSVVYLYFGT